MIQRSSVNSAMPALPPKRPMPEPLTPPKGICASSCTVGPLMWQMPESILRATWKARARSRPKTAALRPYSLAQATASMPTIVAHHKVKDQKHWLASPKRKEFFGPIGVTNIRTFINPNDPTSVALMMDVPDMEKFGAAMQSQGAADARAYDGVLPETVVVCIEA